MNQETTMQTAPHQPPARHGRDHARTLADRRVLDPAMVKATEQKTAADEAVLLLRGALGPQFAQFAALVDAASYRFAPALRNARTTA